MLLITSDFHLGYGYATEREKDCFFVLDEILKQNSDLILFGGDMFDSKLPRLEVLSEAMHFLSKLKGKNSNVEFIECDKKINPRALHGIPFISIYGNHERRASFINPVQSMEKAGLLINLHCQKIVFKVNGEKIAIHGMSYVPERYAKDVLTEWNPKPVEGAKNILLMHQNIEPFIYSPLDDVYLKISDLPSGFDFIVNGHVHWKNKVAVNNGELLIPGSAIPTQLTKKDSEIRKGYFLLDNKAEFKEIKQRDFFYKTVKTTKEIEEFLSGLEEKEIKPIIKIKIKNASSLDLGIIERKYREKGILIFKREIETKFEKQKTEILRKQLSAEDYGIKLLNEKSELGNADELLDLIIDDDTKGIENLLKENFESDIQNNNKLSETIF